MSPIPPPALDGKDSPRSVASSSSIGKDLDLLPNKSLAITVAPAAAPPAPQIVQVNAILSPPEVYKYLVAIGQAKAVQSNWKLCNLSILAGFYVSFGFTFCCCAIGYLNNTIYGALAFPTGLLLIILCGAELFTGNTCYMWASLQERKSSIWQWLRICVVSWWFNLVGSLIMVQMQSAAQIWHGREDWVDKIAKKKMALDWDVVVVRAIFANWLVNLAVMQACAARDVIGKAIGCWTPITAFVAIGLEHCIANQYLIPMSIVLGKSGITVTDFIWKNLIPATIGNTIGGAFFVACLYGMSYGDTVPDAVAPIENKIEGWVKGGCHYVWSGITSPFRRTLPATEDPAMSKHMSQRELVPHPHGHEGPHVHQV